MKLYKETRNKFNENLIIDDDLKTLCNKFPSSHEQIPKNIVRNKDINVKDDVNNDENTDDVDVNINNDENIDDVDVNKNNDEDTDDVDVNVNNDEDTNDVDINDDNDNDEDNDVNDEDVNDEAVNVKDDVDKNEEIVSIEIDDEDDELEELEISTEYDLTNDQKEDIKNMILTKTLEIENLKSQTKESEEELSFYKDKLRR